MATRSGPKAAVRSGKKAARRAPVKVKRGSDVPIMPIAVGGILLALAIAAIVYLIHSNQPSGPAAPTTAGVPCDSLEHTQVHYHVALQIVYQGNLVNLPDNAGIITDSAGNPTCYYWLHVHANNKNVIHIESPATATFTLGQFIAVWKSWAQQTGNPVPKLDSSQVGTFTLGPNDKLVTYVDAGDGKGPVVYTGDPNSIPLKSHEVITLMITPPTVTPPAWNWNSTGNAGL